MARTYVAASQGADVATTSATVWTDCAVLTFTPGASSTYYFLWSGEFGGDVITTDVQFRVFDGTTAYDTGNIEAKDNVPPEYYSQGGIFRIVFGASPGTQNIRVQIKSETAANNVRGRNAEIIAILGVATDAYIETAADAAPSSGAVTVQTLTFTPASTKNYILLGSANVLVNATTTAMKWQLHDSAAVLASSNYMSVSDATGRQIQLVATYEPGLTATSKSFTLRTNTTATGNSATNRRLLALDITGDTVFYDERRAGTATTLATYTDCASFTFTAAANVEHLAISIGSMTVNSAAISGYTTALLDGTAFSESVCEMSIAGSPDGVMGHTGLKLQTLATGSRIIKRQAKIETAGTSVNALESTFLVWQIASAPTSISGPFSTIEAADTLAATGTVRWTGPLAAIETVDVLAATGAVRWSGPLATSEAADTFAATGTVRWATTLAAPEAADVAALAGAVTWIGSLAAPEGADVAAFTGDVVAPASGTLAVTETADTAAFTGGIVGTGTLAVGEAPDVAALVGAIRWAATLATSETADVAALTGAVTWVGTLATTEAPDAAALTGSVRWGAILTASETPDVGAWSGAVRWTAALATAEAPDVAAFAGGIYASGPLDVRELADAAAITATVVTLGTLATSETPDVAAFVGTAFGAGINVNLAAVEPADTAAFTGQVTGVAGALATVEASDVAVISGAARWAATLATVEAPDSAAFTSAAVNAGALATVEAPDSANLMGATRWLAAMAASEAPDVAAFAGTLSEAPSAGTLATVEAPDVTAFTGLLAVGAALATREAPDKAALNVTLIVPATLDATEAPDRARFIQALPDIELTPGHILQNDHRRVRGLGSDEERNREIVHDDGARCRELANPCRVRLLKYPIARPRDLVNSWGPRIRDLDARRRVRILAGD